MFEDSHEKLSQLYLLTLRVVNGVECTTQENGIPPEHPRVSCRVFFQCTQRHDGEGFQSQRGIMVSIFTGNQNTCVYITLKIIIFG